MSIIPTANISILIVNYCFADDFIQKNISMTISLVPCEESQRLQQLLSTQQHFLHVIIEIDDISKQCKVKQIVNTNKTIVLWKDLFANSTIVDHLNKIIQTINWPSNVYLTDQSTMLSSLFQTKIQPSLTLVVLDESSMNKSLQYLQQMNRANVIVTSKLSDIIVNKVCLKFKHKVYFGNHKIQL